jgi:hypothetical protein
MMLGISDHSKSTLALVCSAPPYVNTAEPAQLIGPLARSHGPHGGEFLS